MLPTLFNISLSLILLHSIVEITVLYVCNYVAQPTDGYPILIYHATTTRMHSLLSQYTMRATPSLQFRLPVPQSTPNIPFPHPLTLRHGKAALPHPQRTCPPKLTMSSQPPCPCRTGCLSCQSFGRLMSLGTSAQLK